MDLPIGSIIAWHKNLEGTPALPAGWVECNGGTLDNVDSPYHGKAIPNLNGDKRFLRGGSVSGDLQQDAFQGHHHKVRKEGNNVDFTCVGASGSVRYVWSSSADNTVAKDLVSDGSNGTPRAASETRPINMSVVWIMRVSTTKRASRIIPEEVEDIHVNAITEETPVYGGSLGKIGVTKTPVAAGGGAGTMVEGQVYGGAIPLTRIIVGKLTVAGGGGSKVDNITEADEVEVVFSNAFLSQRIGAPFVYANATFKRWDETNHVWTTLDVEQFAASSTMVAGAKDSSSLGAKIHIKHADPGEAFLIGVTMAQ